MEISWNFVSPEKWEPCKMFSYDEYLLFRWFKFTLKPPYSIACGELQLAIRDTSFWIFWLKFGHKGPRDIS